MWNTGHRGQEGNREAFPSVQARKTVAWTRVIQWGGKQWAGREGLVAIVDVGWAA